MAQRTLGKRQSHFWKLPFFPGDFVRVESHVEEQHIKLESPRCSKIWPSQSRWWFQIFFIFTPIWGRSPFWLIFFRWVGWKTKQQSNWNTFDWYSEWAMKISTPEVRHWIRWVLEQWWGFKERSPRFPTCIFVFKEVDEREPWWIFVWMWDGLGSYCVYIYIFYVDILIYWFTYTDRRWFLGLSVQGVFGLT